MRSPSKTGARFINSGLSAVSGRLFPDTRHLTEDAEIHASDIMSVTNTEVASSLSLQMLLYFNVQYAFFWGLLVLAIMVFRENYIPLNPSYLVLCPLLLSVWAIAEPVRLYFGYVGNLQEKVPQLTGFWLLTLIPQLPIAFFYIIALPISVSPSGRENAVSLHMPFDRAGSIVLLILYTVEAIVGYFALRNMVRSQVLKFHMLTVRTREASSAERRQP